MSNTSGTKLQPQATLRDYNEFLEKALKQHDQEKVEWFRRFDEMLEAQQNLGDLRHELTERSRQLADVQSLNNELRVALQEEREKVGRLISENHVLSAQAEDDRSKIAELIKMRKTELCEQSGDASQDPSAVMLSVMRTPTAGGRGGGARRGAAVTTAAAANDTSIMRSISLRSAVAQCGHGGSKDHMQQHIEQVLQPAPGSPLVVALGKEVETLKSLIEQQRQSYEHDRSVRVAESRSRDKAHFDSQKAMSQTIDRLQEQLNTATKDICEMRHEYQINLRTLRGENEGLVSRAAEAERLLTAERARHTNDMQVALEAQQSRSTNLVEDLRLRLREHDEAALIDRQRLDHRIRELEALISKMREALERERRMRTRIEELRKSEVEGRKTDVNLMRQQLRAVEKRLFFGAFRDEDLVEVPVVSSEDSSPVQHHNHHQQQQQQEIYQPATKRGASSTARKKKTTTKAAATGLVMGTAGPRASSATARRRY